MSSLKMDFKTKIYLYIMAGSLVIWRIGLSLRATSLINNYIIKKMLLIFPDFILCVAIPFGLLAFIHYFKITKNETRIFYYILYLVLFLVIFVGFIVAANFSVDFDIYNIIASFMALFIDMVIQDHFESKMKVE